jgi:hypothetical protein
MQTQIWEDALSRSKECGVGQQLLFLVLLIVCALVLRCSLLNHHLHQRHETSFADLLQIWPVCDYGWMNNWAKARGVVCLCRCGYIQYNDCFSVSTAAAGP